MPNVADSLNERHQPSRIGFKPTGSFGRSSLPNWPGASGDRDPVLSSSPHPTGCDEPRDFRIFSIIDRHAALQLLEPFDDELSMGVTVVYPDPTFPMTYVDGEQLRESASLGVVFLSCEDAVTQAPTAKL